LRKIADKLIHLRIFEDREGKMNLSAKSVGGEFMVVSQFTLYGDTSKGRRPSFTKALAPKEAERLYLKFVEYLRECGFRVETGEFGARMEIELINDGPVTFIIEE
jgi:D-tyrosyl-tRNA(Tyr) deacylase